MGTLAAARYDEVEILYKLPDRIGNIYPDRFAKEATYECGGRRKEDKDWTYDFNGEGFLKQRVSNTESIESYDWAGLSNLYAYVHEVNAWVDPWGQIKVSTTVALQDVMNRGLHVNVIEGKKGSMLHSKQLWMVRFLRGLNWYLQIPKAGKKGISKNVQEAK